MSRPRRVLPGKTYLFTRRTVQRQFWLTPTPLTTQILHYCYGYAAGQTGMSLHAAMGMSNHAHLVGTDAEGCYPDFLHRSHLLISKCINASYGRWEALWNSSKPSAVELLDDEKVLDEIVYTLANPVAAGLVSHGEQWPGMRTTPEELAGARYVVKRPDLFFDDDGDMPDKVVFEIVRPPIFDDLSDAELVQHARQRLDATEAEHRNTMRNERRTFLGADAVLAVEPSASPTTFAPRRNMSPRFAASCRKRLGAAIASDRIWQVSYSQCRQRFIDGDRDIQWPAGTWAHARYLGVDVVATVASVAPT